jgi:hypothetical protein
MKKSKKNVINLLVEVHHGNEQLNKPIGGIQDNKNHKDVLRRFIIVHMINIWQLVYNLWLPSQTKYIRLDKDKRDPINGRYQPTCHYF